MEFVDNTGHIFSLPSYDKKPIGYEYEENPYIFWIDSQTANHLSIDNYYGRVINVLFEVEDTDIDVNERYSFEISMDSKVFTLISPLKFNEQIDNLSSIKDCVNIVDTRNGIDLLSQRLTNDDLIVIKTTEKANGATYKYLMIPLYVIATTSEEGTWSSNIMIHIHDNDEDISDVWCPITVGGTFINDYEALIINGKNMGVNLPKDILRAVYNKSFYDNEFDVDLYNEKLKEYLINYMTIKGECGNFRSVIDSFKWFGWGDKLTVSKLIKTDNEFQDQYILDYFNISTDILDSYRTFRNTTYTSLYVSLNVETDDEYEQHFDEYFWGEGKPKLIDLMEHYIKVNVGHDLDIKEDREKYWYWKPYYDFTFVELGLKLACLKHYVEKYFLPIHLKIHTATLSHKVFANDIKLSVHEKIALTEAPIEIGSYNKDVDFLGNGIHYFTKQIHWTDNSFNEFGDTNTIDDWYYINDTCVNIPIKFLVNGENGPKYHDCILLLERKLPNDGYNYVVYIDKKIKITDKIQAYRYGYDENMSYEDKLSYKIDMSSIWFSYKTDRSDNWSLYFKGYDKMIEAVNKSNTSERNVDEIYVKFKYKEELLGALAINGNTYELDDKHDEYFYTNDIHIEQTNTTELIYESHFRLVQTMASTTYKNFIIYPKMLNSNGDGTTKNIDYWANKDYILRILCNGRWYNYEFSLKIPDVSLYFGKLEYKYWLNDNNWLMYKLHMADPEHEWLNAAAIVLSDKYIVLNKAKNALAYGNISDNEVSVIDLATRFEGAFTQYGEESSIELDTQMIDDIFKSIEDDDKTVDDDNFAIFYKEMKKEGMTDNFRRNWQFIDFTNRYMSNFSQLRYMDDSTVRFNSFMHNHGLVDVNNINFDTNFFKIIKYSLENHLQYIDGKYLDNDEFYHYIEMEDGQRIIIGNEVVGRNFKVPAEYLSRYNLTVFFYMNMYFVLREEGHNVVDDEAKTDKWKIIYTDQMDNMGDPIDSVFKEDLYVLLEDDEIDHGLFVNFTYDKTTGKYVDTSGNQYEILERLNNNELNVYDKYISNINLPKSDKYLNNMHLFNIYKTYEDKKNILIFHNDIHMSCNGLIFEHSKYDQYDPESTKIYIHGNMFKSNDPDSEIDAGLLKGADTREPDIYTKYWNDGEPDIREVPVVKYVYYQKTDNKGEPIENSYSTSLFSEYVDTKTYTPICTIIAKTTDDFENGNFVDGTLSLADEYADKEISIYKTKYEYEASTSFTEKTPSLWIKSISTIDTTDPEHHTVKTDKYWMFSENGNDNDVYYKVTYVKQDANGIWVEHKPTASEYANNTIQGYKIEFLYNKKYIVKNKRIEVAESQYIRYDSAGNKYIDLGDGNKEYVIEYDSMAYYDKRPSKGNGFGAKIQNPGMYWFNADKNGFESLKDSLDSLKKYWPNEKAHGEYIDSKTFIIKDGSLEIDNYISSNKEQQYEIDIDNETETKLWSTDPTVLEEEFRNYLTKEITGLTGRFSLDYDTNDSRIKLVVAIEDSEGNTRLVEGYGTEFELDGTEKEVLAFLQVEDTVVDEAISFNDDLYWINPIINRIYIRKDMLKYDVNTYDESDLVKIKFKGNEYAYGNNTSSQDVELYNDFFYECYKVYGVTLDDNNNFVANEIRYAYEGNPTLHMMLEYDFYLMHDHEYWYGIFISRDTIDKVMDKSYLNVPEEDKKIIIKPKQKYDKSNNPIQRNFEYILEYVRSDNQMLLNRMEMVESGGVNHFNRDDIVWGAIWNNNRLPINIDLGTKWVYEPMSIGMTKTISNVSNSEVCMMPVPNGDNSYPIGYYDVTVRYSLDRDVNHQTTKRARIRIV